MRKLAFPFLFLLAFCAPAMAGNISIPQTALPEAITFQGVTMHKADEQAANGTFITEYIPKGETLKHWTHLFAVRREASKLTPKERAAGFAAYLKKLNSQFRSQVLFDKKTGNTGIDFLIWPKDDSFGEFNTWKYMQGEPGWLYSFQYGVRGYTDTPSYDELEHFMKKKQGAVFEMMRFELPSSM
ncbi:hypothetical protein [Pseudodesulfovibrio sp.]|uniref:hypothetical protein n=1 Tax=unclassified Pseudodesulfovibrio TaxID=2661612 RepID=UPI003B00BE34